MALIYFLIVYDAKRGILRSCEEYVYEDVAMRDFAQLEFEHRGDRELQILLLTSDSIETLKTTHSHYFADGAKDDMLTVFANV